MLPVSKERIVKSRLDVPKEQEVSHVRMEELLLEAKATVLANVNLILVERTAKQQMHAHKELMEILVRMVEIQKELLEIANAIV